MDIKEILKATGDQTALITNQILTAFNDSGIITSLWTAKLISLLVILGITWIILHVFQSIKTPVKFLIYIVSGILTISILYTFFNK